MEHSSHFFFAVRIPEQTKLRMQEHIEKIKERIPFSRWVHYQDLHITLAFLGSAPPDKLKQAENQVQEALKDVQTFTLKINKLGFFGNVDSPRVFWADTEESKNLQSIRNKVFSACEEAGFQLETRPFRPHITLARKWKGEQPFQPELLGLWEEFQPVPLSFEAVEVVIYQTHLDKTPKYEAIKIYPLVDKN
ncbi:RNA 2',3'-cyclic phosphodiesterase [Neobacillus sp. OS1-33]|uniref:RNA 2',3'-cyclic phosphodiesterase n=1 Tax=Neobacillus sp. OS1-33 TaxID=3070683 RepID=UPI0027DEFC1D|nr:RNA 2',3'-cyclic phosphodiesterase [Neobacillus sp. OS1-33]WML25264.1 RNA 2',3'-cyclic phosphodiesterase [Neobacillus sp. OS1-33]